jgi:hypothetical protein
MSIMENQSQTAAPQTQWIGTEEEQELNYWSNKFGIAKEELLAVVKRGGTFAAAVENYVKRATLAV